MAAQTTRAISLSTSAQCSCSNHRQAEAGESRHRAHASGRCAEAGKGWGCFQPRRSRPLVASSSRLWAEDDARRPRLHTAASERGSQSVSDEAFPDDAKNALPLSKLYKKEDLEKLTVPELKAILDDLGLQGYSNEVTEEMREARAQGQPIDPRVAHASALHAAALDRKPEVVKLLLEAGQAAAYGVTPLLWAASNGAAEVVRLLVEKGTDVNMVNNNGDTALHVSAFEGHTEVVEALVAAGADTAAHNRYHDTPLHVAAYRGNAAVVAVLAPSAAAAAAAAAPAEPPPEGVAGDTPLHLAAFEGHVEVVRVLANAGVDVNAALPVTGVTPLHHAASRGHTEVARVLLGSGADIQARTDEGATPLTFAAVLGHKETLQLLRGAWAAALASRNRESPN